MTPEEFTNHVGAPTFEEAVDVTFRTKAQDEEKIESMFNQVKALSARLAESEAGRVQAERERDEALSRILCQTCGHSVVVCDCISLGSAVMDLESGEILQAEREMPCPVKTLRADLTAARAELQEANSKIAKLEFKVSEQQGALQDAANDFNRNERELQEARRERDEAKAERAYLKLQRDALLEMTWLDLPAETPRINGPLKGRI